MFIPVNAKADIVGSKKGKITPSQNAVINAWSLSKKVGILAVGDKCEATNMIYTSVGDIATVVFKHGFFVVYGRLVEVEAGTTVDIKLPSFGEEKGNIIAKFKLDEMQDKEFRVFAATDPLVQQDLTEEDAVECDFVLYSYTATPSGVTLTARDESVYIQSTKEEIIRLRTWAEGEFNSIFNGGKPAAKAHDYTATGTIAMDIKRINKRLDEMGFNKGSVSLTNGTATPLLEVSQSQEKVQLAKQGNYVIGHFSANSTIGLNNTAFTLPENFRPNKTMIFGVNVTSTGQGKDFIDGVTLTINTDGTAVFSGTISGYTIKAYNINFGFEASEVKA
jgi:hypothetical protein